MSVAACVWSLAVLRQAKLPRPQTAIDLVALDDAALDQLDPLVINLIVAREIPSLHDLDIGRYVKVVDEWAEQIRRGLEAQEPSAKHEAAYRHDPNLWRAGGMAVALAGPSIGIKYTADRLDAGVPAQTFAHGVIDTKRGTCSNMPVLYMAIGHRLGWPLKGVVSKDHFWCRWHDTSPKATDKSRFNLEATNASSAGGLGSFASLTDEEYAKWLGTPRHAISSGSDFTTLSKRNLLGVFLQARAGYWEARNNWPQAEQDLLLARLCFPENRDILAFQLTATGHQAARLFTPPEQKRLAGMVSSNAALWAQTPRADDFPRFPSGPRPRPVAPSPPGPDTANGGPLYPVPQPGPSQPFDPMNPAGTNPP